MQLVLNRKCSLQLSPLGASNPDAGSRSLDPAVACGGQGSVQWCKEAYSVPIVIHWSTLGTQSLSCVLSAGNVRSRGLEGSSSLDFCYNPIQRLTALHLIVGCVVPMARLSTSSLF